MFSKKRAGRPSRSRPAPRWSWPAAPAAAARRPRRGPDVRPGRGGHARPRVLGQRRARRPVQPGRSTAFNEEYPNITVNSTFLGVPGVLGEAPDRGGRRRTCPTSCSSTTRTCASTPRTGCCSTSTRTSATSSRPSRCPQNILDIGVVNDTTYGIPTSTNAWGLFTNPVLLEQAGVEEFAGGSWEDYADWMGEVTDGSGGAFWGGTDFTGRIQNFELQLRSEGSYLFSEDGEPGFDEERLTEFWESGAGHPRRHRHPAAASSRRSLPKGGFDTRADRERAHVGQLRRRLPRRPRRGLHRARPRSLPR